MTGPAFPDVTVPMVGEDGNVFSIIGRVTRALREAGEKEAAAEFRRQAFDECDSYDAVLRLVLRTVTTE